MNVAQLIILSLVLIFAEEMLLPRLHEGITFPHFSKGGKGALYTGATMLVLQSAAMPGVWGMSTYFEAIQAEKLVRTAVFCLLLALCTVILWLLRKLCGIGGKTANLRLAVIAGNALLLGLWQLLTQPAIGMVNSGICAAVAVAGFVLTGVVLQVLAERLRFSQPPKVFCGWPLQLVTTLLLIMAAIGLSGVTILL